MAMIMMKALRLTPLARRYASATFRTLARRSLPQHGVAVVIGHSTTRGCQPRLKTTTTVRSLASALPDHDDEEVHSSPLFQTYYDLLRNSEVHEDEHQTEALESLDRLRRDLFDYQPPKQLVIKKAPAEEKAFSTFGGWWTRASRAAGTVVHAAKTSKTVQPRGVYLHGGVGCGKTFCMNLFYDAIDESHPWADEKQKIHFHKFMLQVHQEMHNARKATANHALESDTILPAVIEQTVKNGRLICLE